MDVPSRGRRKESLRASLEQRLSASSLVRCLGDLDLGLAGHGPGWRWLGWVIEAMLINSTPKTRTGSGIAWFTMLREIQEEGCVRSSMKQSQGEEGMYLLSDPDPAELQEFWQGNMKRDSLRISRD